MATLTIDLVFSSLSEEDLITVWDQTEQIKKDVEQSVKALPLGKYLTEVMVW